MELGWRPTSPQESRGYKRSGNGHGPTGMRCRIEDVFRPPSLKPTKQPSSPAPNRSRARMPAPGPPGRQPARSSLLRARARLRSS